MTVLGFLDADDCHSPFPPLTLEDTFMKLQQCKCTVGDSRQPDGLIWNIGSVTSGSKSPPFALTGADEEAEDESSIGKLYSIFLMPCTAYSQ
jgi:hypothetical protein